MNAADFKVFAEEIESSFTDTLNATEAFVAIDYNLCFLYLNQKAEKFYKKNKADLIGRTLEEIFPERRNFAPFKKAIQSVVTRKHLEINYHSPFIESWIQLTGRPFENYYTFTFRSIDHKESLKKELRREVGKTRHR
jgi:PAS domain-containing protein